MIIRKENKDGKAKRRATIIEVRQAKMEDIGGILELEEEVWPEGLRVTRPQLISRIETFPGGILVVVTGNTIVGVVATQIVNYDLEGPGLTWREVTDNGFIKRTHNPNGDTLYGVDLSVSHFGINASLLLMEQLGKLVIRRNLKRAILGARIPRYYRVADKIGAEEYVNSRRKDNRCVDPELMFYTRFGFRVVKVIPNYIEDPESCNYGVLMVWDNPFYGRPFLNLWSRFFKLKK